MGQRRRYREYGGTSIWLDEDDVGLAELLREDGESPVGGPDRLVCGHVHMGGSTVNLSLTDGRREVAEIWRRQGPPDSTTPQHVQILVTALLDALEEAEQTRDQLLSMRRKR